MCPWTDKSVHICLAGSAELHGVPLFEKQKPCFVVGWEQRAGTGKMNIKLLSVVTSAG